jgi:hypothetical protein
MQQPIPATLDSAIRELGSAIGPEHVLANPDVLAEYGRATFETTQPVAHEIVHRHYVRPRCAW